MIHPSAHHNTHNNNSTNTSNSSNNVATSKSLLSGSPNPSSASKKLLLLGEMHDPTGQGDDQDTTSVCSSVSSLTDDEDNHNTNNSNGQAPATITLKKKSRFSICKAKTNLTPKNGTANASPVTNAVSISFLSSPNNNLKSSSTNTTGRQGQATNPKQVIQRALASLRPGGVFFVLDYKEEEDDVDSTEQAQSPSAQSQSRAMKEIPQDLLQKWNLTMVPSDLETFYNTRLSTKTSKLAPKVKAPLPASKRIVRWMGVKPVAPSRPAATN